MEAVVVESPFAGKGDTEAERDRGTERNLRYLRAIMADCFKRMEAPYASHGLYTQVGVLNDKLPAERELGMNAGFLWGEFPRRRVVYTDLGMSRGMEAGIEKGQQLGQQLEERKLGLDWDAKTPQGQVLKSVSPTLANWISSDLDKLVGGEDSRPDWAEGESYYRGYADACDQFRKLLKGAV